MARKNNPPERLRHRAKSVRADGAVSSMCFKTPRAIDMKRATWTTDRRAVTCPKCAQIVKRLMEGTPVAPGDKLAEERCQ